VQRRRSTDLADIIQRSSSPTGIFSFVCAIFVHTLITISCVGSYIDSDQHDSISSSITTTSIVANSDRRRTPSPTGSPHKQGNIARLAHAMEKAMSRGARRDDSADATPPPPAYWLALRESDNAVGLVRSEHVTPLPKTRIGKIFHNH
jgi:hypothetical protein